MAPAAPAPPAAASGTPRTASQAGLAPRSDSTTRPRLPAGPLPNSELKAWHDVEASAKYPPKAFQKEAIDIIVRRKDGLVVAPTGSGKNYVLQLARQRMPERILIVFAPLIILIEEIAKSLGSEAVYLHAENRAPTLFAEIKALKYKVIVLSLEMAASNAFRDVFKEPAFQARLGAIIFDECQTLKDWAVDTAFRRGLKDVSVIRHLAEVPGVAMSGTLPAAYRKEVLTYFELDDPVIVDVGVDRPNIKVTIAPIRQTISSYLDLLCWLPELHVAVPETDAEKKACEDACWPTIIYVNNKTQQLDIYYAVHSWYSRLGMMHAVLLFSAEMSTSHRRRVKELVEKGGIKCVVSTSALGMGSDMPVISRVIQWRIADSLAAIMQRIGRAGRDPSKLANGVILVDPWAVHSGAGGPASGGVTEESLAAALLAAEAGGRDDLDDIEDTNEPGSGETDEDFAKAVSETKSSKKFKVDIELMKVVHRALTKSGCVRALINQYLGQPPADKTPAPEDIFGAKLVTTRPCCCVCDPEPLPDPPEYAMPSKSTESRARAGITKLQEWVEPKLREWRVRKWTTEWSKDETAPTWRGLSYFFGVDDLAAVLKNLGKIDKAIVSNSDPMIVSYLQAEMKAVTGPQVLEYLKTEIAAHDAKLEEDRRSERRATDRRQDDRALQRALDKAKRKETTAIAQHAEGSIRRVNHCKECVEWNQEHQYEARRPTGGHNAGSSNCPTRVERDAAGRRASTSAQSAPA